MCKQILEKLHRLRIVNARHAQTDATDYTYTSDRAKLISIAERTTLTVIIELVGVERKNVGLHAWQSIDQKFAKV